MRGFVVVLLLGLCLSLSCYDGKQGGKVVAIDDVCRLVDAAGKTITELGVKDDDVVRWSNHSTLPVKIVVSDPKVLSGRRSLRLAPGESVAIRVGGRKGMSMVSWYCGGGGDNDDDDDNDTDKGRGGGNSPVNNGGGG